MKRKSVWFWAYLAIFVAHVAGFYISYLREDAVNMIWYTVVGAGWGVMVKREGGSNE